MFLKEAFQNILPQLITTVFVNFLTSVVLHLPNKRSVSTTNSPMLAKYWRTSLCWAGYWHTTTALFSVVAIEDANS